MKNIKAFLFAWCVVCYLFLFFTNSASADTLIVTTTTDSGPGSFRQAIIDAEANNSFQIDRIVFDSSVFPPASPQSITLLSALPVITVPVEIDATNVCGSLNSMANSSFTIEFFSNTSCHTLGYGEGQTFLGSISVVTDGNGNTIFYETLQPVEAGLFITATANDASNNTSEFSACIEVVEGSVSALVPILTPLLLD